MKTIDFTAIIVSYNSAEHIRQCLRSLYKYSENAEQTVEIIVVDNASTDGSTDLIKNDFPDVKLLENTNNEGYARAINRGLEIAQGNYCIIMNPDTEITENVFSPLLTYLNSSDDVGAAGLRLVFPDGSPQRSFFKFPSLRGRLAHLTGIPRFINIETLKQKRSYTVENSMIEVDMVCGAFLVIKRDLLMLLNGFDPDYFLYHEEADLCFRIRKLGKRNVVLWKYSLIHHGVHREKAENLTVFYHHNRSLLIYFHKHRSFTSLLLLMKINIIALTAGYIFNILPFGNTMIRTKKRKNYRAVLKYHIRFATILFRGMEDDYPD